MIDDGVKLAVEAVKPYDASVYTGARMPLNIHGDDANRLARKLASQGGPSKAEAERIAPVDAVQRREEAVPLAERLRPLRDEIAAVPRTGLEAGKAVYDSLDEA